MKKFWLSLSSLLLTACSTTTNLYVDHLASNVQDENFTDNVIILSDNEHHTQVHYWDNQKASQDTVVLIHGVGGDALSNWQSTMVALGEQYRVIAPDILWYGQSTSDLQPTLEDQVATIHELLEQLNVTGRIHLVGHSYGGFIVYGLLANNDIATTATIISSPGGAFEQKDLDALMARFGIDKPSELFVPSDDAGLKRLMNATSEDQLHVPAFTMDGFYEKYFASNSVQKAYMLDHLMDSREGFVTKVDAKKTQQTLPPMQLIWGEGDRIFPLENGMLLSKQVDAPLYIVTDTAHNILLEKPDTVNRLLKGFIQQYARQNHAQQNPQTVNASHE
ncbi:alpha/beta fold hydrolase [Vibrio gangliei]|uniref:alpha/beta fold hydrolase n=1 Tax=Vibrio gangliei TaxID=2077090 RepID=UPI000D021DE3|nr:alpha/beta fold hydrolase [Vibrio gangliei]